MMTQEEMAYIYDLMHGEPDAELFKAASNVRFWARARELIKARIWDAKGQRCQRHLHMLMFAEDALSKAIVEKLRSTDNATSETDGADTRASGVSRQRV